MATERHYLRSVVKSEFIDEARVPDIPRCMDTRIQFCLYKVTRNCWVEVPSKIVDGPQKLITKAHAFVLLSDVKQLSKRSKHTRVMAKKLSRMYVPEDEHAAIIEKLFRVIEVAVPGIPIFVYVWDVTLRFLDSAASVGPQALTRSLVAPGLIFDLEDGGMIGNRAAMQSMEINGLYGPEPELIPATNSFIEGLEKVSFDSLETTVRQMPCAICMEGLDHFAVEGGTDQQLMLTRLPCSHLFHGDCVVQWLESNHLCPLCRYPMPTVEVEVEMEAGEPSEPSRSLHCNMLMMSAGGLLTTAMCFALQMVERKLKMKISDYLVYAVPLVAIYSAKFL